MFLIVFGISFYTLIVELALSRMASFYLNYSNSFLAIPITLFGLALGSLRIHLQTKKDEPFDPRPDLFALLCSSFGAFLLVFLLFSEFFPIIRHEVSLLTLARGLTFCTLFLVPFYFVGKLLTLIFARHPEQIGRLYAWDLCGAALGSFLTPVALHFVDLPYLIFLAHLAIGWVWLSFRFESKRFLAILGTSILTLLVMLFLEGRYDLSKSVAFAWSRKSDENATVRQIKHRWNEFSRVALLEIKSPAKSYYRIIHDNAESNVAVRPYIPLSENPPVPDQGLETLPYALNRKPKDILVMFAGAGAQMVSQNVLSNGQAHITGVEINPLVAEFAISPQQLQEFRLSEFYRCPHIRLLTLEGRSFLETTKQKFDLIFVASDAPTAQYKTGNTRKFLDTVEAMERYVDRLTPNGLLIFQGQRGDHKIVALKEIFSRRTLGNLSEHLVILSSHWGYLDSLIISLTPWTVQEIKTIQNHAFGRDDILFLPQRPENDRLAQTLLLQERPKDPPLVTDNRPFVDVLDFSAYTPLPALKQIRDVPYYKSWIRITTLGLVLAISAALLAFLYFQPQSKKRMPPTSMMLFLFVTGFCYMLCEVIYIAKLELLLGNLLYSMALLFALFLVGNGMGSFLYEHFSKRIYMPVFLLGISVLVLVTLYGMDAMTSGLISQSLLVKIPVASLLIFPTAMVLGFCYPYAITWLSQNQRKEAIPITYAVSTISSVVGATYAMTLVINFGYRMILTQAALGYALLAGYLFVTERDVPTVRRCKIFPYNRGRRY